MDKMPAQRHWLRRFGGQIAHEAIPAGFLGENARVSLMCLRKRAEKRLIVEK
jgi:hypothetical protein